MRYNGDIQILTDPKRGGFFVFGALRAKSPKVRKKGEKWKI